MRRNLATYASVLEEAETLPREQFRDRVRDLVVEMAATGQTGMRFPEEYGGGDIGGSIAGFETLAWATSRCWSSVGVQFGLFGGRASCTSAPSATTSATCATDRRVDCRAASR